MHTENEIELGCSTPRAFELARQVERWPGLLGHYRWVRFHQGSSAQGGVVEMAAVRRFGRWAWPVWWVSRMDVEPSTLTVRYRHLSGITRGMEVEWTLSPTARGTHVRVLHRWGRPWLGRLPAAKLVGPHFVHVVAGQTLKGLSRWAQAEDVP